MRFHFNCVDNKLKNRGVRPISTLESYLKITCIVNVVYNKNFFADEIYNTASMSSDLGWKSPPNDDEVGNLLIKFY